MTPISASLARPLIDGLKNNVVCRDKSVQDVMPHRCLGYRESVEKALLEEGRGRIAREGRGYRLTWSQWVKTSPGKVMEFFGDPKNLKPTTPAGLGFRLLEPFPARLSTGEKLNYRIRIWGVPLHWTTEILTWKHPESFSDTQTLGPYRQWLHQHRFSPQDGGTLIGDDVYYELPFGFLGRLVHPG